MKIARSGLVLWLILPALACALGPHEVLILANEQSAESLAVAEHYARLRHVPEVNVVRVRLPIPTLNSGLAITPEEFDRLVWSPAVRAVRQRGIGDHILAWAYSVDFPTTIGTSPEISILGLTFLRNQLPKAQEVEGGTYASPLFGGPGNPRGGPRQPRTLDTQKEWEGETMPLPAILLGYIGPRGTSKDTVLKGLDRAAASDGTAPTGTIYFVTNNDVRSTCRQWQFPDAVKELGRLGVRAVITDRLPTGARDVLGLMTGAETVQLDPDFRCLPGSMAEHLTSLAAVFASAGQTKLTVWLEAGAAASAGTVTEPRAAWPKFPSARFYVYYASGCTLLESFYQSLRCPLQTLIVGDPLAQPWKPADTIAFTGLDGTDVSGTVRLNATVQAATDSSYTHFLYLLDGRAVGGSRSVTFDTTAVKDGPHTLRVIASRNGLLRTQVFAEKTIVVRNRGPAAPAKEQQDPS